MRNDYLETQEYRLKRLCMELGGVRMHRNGREREEHLAIPLCFRRKNGIPIDELADHARRARIINDDDSTPRVIEMLGVVMPRQRKTKGNPIIDRITLITWLCYAPSIWWESINRPIPCDVVENWRLSDIYNMMRRGKFYTIKEHEHLVFTGNESEPF